MTVISNDRQFRDALDGLSETQQREAQGGLPRAGRPGNVERELAAMREALGRLRQRFDTAEHPRVRQDLEILIRAAERNIEGTEVRHELQVPFFSVTSTVFQGLRVGP